MLRAHGAATLCVLHDCCPAQMFISAWRRHPERLLCIADAVVRGHRTGLLSSADYNNLAQCESLDDIKLNLVRPPRHLIAAAKSCCIYSACCLRAWKPLRFSRHDCMFGAAECSHAVKTCHMETRCAEFTMQGNGVSSEVLLRLL